MSAPQITKNVARCAAESLYVYVFSESGPETNLLFLTYFKLTRLGVWEKVDWEKTMEVLVKWWGMAVATYTSYSVVRIVPPITRWLYCTGCSQKGWWGRFERGSGLEVWVWEKGEC